MSKEHHLIIIPGLGDDVKWINWATKGWSRFGITPHVESAHWKDIDESVGVKIERLVKSMDVYLADGEVSLLGISAGGGLVLNAYCLRKDKIQKMVVVSGRMREGIDKPSLREAAREHKAFYNSVIFAEDNETRLTDLDRKKFLTTRGLQDNTVPVSTTPIEGVRNVQIPAIGHLPSIVGALTIFRKPVIDFLTLDS